MALSRLQGGERWDKWGEGEKGNYVRENYIKGWTPGSWEGVL